MLVGKMWLLEDHSICHPLQDPNLQPWETRESFYVFSGSKRGEGKSLIYALRARSCCIGSAHAGGADRAVHQDKVYGDGEAALKDAADHNAVMMTRTKRTAGATHATGRNAAMKVASVHTATEDASLDSGIAEMVADEIERVQSAAAF